MNLFERTERAITRLAGGLALLGGLGLILATVITCVSIVLKMSRRGLDTLFGGAFSGDVPWAFIRPILGEEELVSLAVGFAVFAALPWVTLQKGHIRIDLFEQRFGKMFNRLLDLMGDLLLLVLAYLLVTRQWFLIFAPARRRQEPMMDEIFGGNFAVIGERLRDSHESQILGLKLWPSYVVAELCILAFLVVAAFCVLRSARALFGAGHAA
ncbi:MAG: TRAP transporter small permease subunit [Pseudomonadota bacterium]